MAFSIMEDKDRPAKLRKLETFRRSLPYVSASALSAILKELDREEPPELKGRKHLKEARDYITPQETVYGPLLVDVPVQMSNGSQKGIQIVNFLALLQLLYEQEGSFFNLVEPLANSHVISVTVATVSVNMLVHRMPVSTTHNIWNHGGRYLRSNQATQSDRPVPTSG